MFPIGMCDFVDTYVDTYKTTFRISHLYHVHSEFIFKLRLLHIDIMRYVLIIEYRSLIS